MLCHAIRGEIQDLAGDIPVLEVTAPRELMTWPFRLLLGREWLTGPPDALPL
jgi:hypothetical protein